MKTILFTFSILHAPREMLPVVEYFLSRNWRVTVLLSFYGAVADETERRCLAMGAAVYRTPRAFAYVQSDKPGEKSAPATATERPRRKKFQKLRRLANAVLSAISYYTIIAKQKKYASALLNKVSADAIVCNNFQSCGKIDDVFLHMIHKRRIPAFCVLCSPLVGKKISQRGRLNHLEFGMLPPETATGFDFLTRLTAKFFPQWTFGNTTGRVFLFDPILLLAAKWAGILPADIWQCPSTLFRRVFIHNEISQSILEQSGFPMDKVVVSGPPRLDPIFQSLAAPAFVKSFWEQLGSNEPEPYVLWNIEPSFEHNYATKEKHWENFYQIYNCLKEANVRTILSLHPLCTLENYIFVESDSRFTISRTHGIEILYPFCQFALSFPCSTNIYAKYFNKQLIIYDWSGMRKKTAYFEEFHLSCGASLVSTTDELTKTVQAMMTKTTHTGPDAFLSSQGNKNASCTIYDSIEKYIEAPHHELP